MSGVVGDILLLGGLLFPLVAMPLLWRRMKRVRDRAYNDSPSLPRQSAWQETLDTRQGLNLAHSYDPNEDLMALGEKARQSPWPIINQ